MFPASPLPQLNEHTCGKGWRCDWYLVVDKYEFHVYVAAVCHAADSSKLQVRCDWHTDSTLTFRPFEFDRLEQHLPVGQSQWFCRLCCVEQLQQGMQQYQLFKFNCRTLSYLILWRVMGFDHAHVYKQFESLHILCGLEPDQCLSLDEIHRYFAYRKENKSRYAWPLVDAAFFLSRDLTRTPYAHAIDDFQAGDTVIKCCEPYGPNKFLLNKTLQLRAKQYHPSGQLWYVIVSDDTVDGALHLTADYFHGWLNSALLTQCRHDRALCVLPLLRQSFGVLSEHHSASRITLQLHSVQLAFDADLCRCKIRHDETTLREVDFTEARIESLFSVMPREEPGEMPDSVDALVIEGRNKLRMERARPLDSFREGDQLFKHCAPYGTRCVLFNRAIELRYKVHDASGALYRAGVVLGDAVYWLGADYFEGWTNARAPWWL